METPLELLHLMRHRGLRQVQLLRRGGETATRDDLDERPQLIEIETAHGRIEP